MIVKESYAISCVLECWEFLRRHWVHLLLFAPAAVGYTIAHESSHALAVILQGGRITEFTWLPSATEWGHVRYEFDPGWPYCEWMISIAPYLMLLVGSIIACVTSIFVRFLKPWVASTVFVWLFFVPLADFANVAIPYGFSGSENDLAHAFGAPTLGIRLVLGAIGCVVIIVGYFLQKRLYGEKALSKSGYVLMGVFAAVIACVVWMCFSKGRAI